MKAPLTRFYCMSKECDFEETTHKLKEGIPCPKCKGPVLSQRVKIDKPERSSKAMANINATININNIFALSNWTSTEGRFFTTLKGAIDAGKECDSTDDVAIVEMVLQGNEFVEVKRYESNGELMQEVEEGC